MGSLWLLEQIQSRRNLPEPILCQDSDRETEAKQEVGLAQDPQCMEPLGFQIGVTGAWPVHAHVMGTLHVAQPGWGQSLGVFVVSMRLASPGASEDPVTGGWEPVSWSAGAPLGQGLGPVRSPVKGPGTLGPSSLSRTGVILSTRSRVVSVEEADE